MSNSPLGERYFSLRERLTGLLRGIEDLAAETDTDIGNARPNGNLEEPFRLLVCGEVNAGKSSLINGLCGFELCKTNVLPETHRVLIHRHRSADDDATPAHPLVETVGHNHEFLRNFEIIDTPGTNSSVKGTTEAIQSVVPSADLVMVVFPVTNPWGAATWDLVSHLSNDALDRTILVIQQADQRKPEDLKVILGHMADLSMKRGGRVPPIFAVSATTAIQARQSTPPAATLLAQSGYPDLEDHISRFVCLSKSRRKALETWREQTARALRLVDDRIDKQKRILSNQGRFMDEVEREIDGIRDTFVARLPSHLENVARTFESEGINTTRTLRRQLAALPSFMRLFTGDRTGEHMQSAFIENLKQAVTLVAEKDGDNAVTACRSHWDNLAERIRETIGIEPAANTPVDDTLANSRTGFVNTIAEAAHTGISNLKVRNQLDRDLRKRNKSLKAFIASTLIFTILGATSGALRLPWLPAVFCSIAALFLCGAFISAWITRSAISNSFQNRLLDTCGTFASTLQSDYEQALRSVFQDYGTSLDSVRARLVSEKQSMEPRAKRWQELFLALKTLELEL